MSKSEKIRIVCATDLLAKSEAALDRAGVIAGELNASLSMLHVVMPANSVHVLEQELRSSIEQMKVRSRPPLWREGPAPDVMLRVGNPARVIADAIEQEKIGLLVLGPHGKRGIRDPLEDTLATRMLAARKCPVLIVREAPRGAYKNVLLALDLSNASAGAVRAAEQLTINASTDVSVIHAYEPPYQGMLSYVGVGADKVLAYSRGWKREAETAVRDLLKWQSADFSRYDLMIEERRPTPAILRAVQRVKPDLIVMGTRGHGRARRALLGSVATQILRQAKCDLLVVPDGSQPASRAIRRMESGASARGSQSTFAG